MSAIKFYYDTRERAIEDNIIAEFSKPHNFAVTKGTIELVKEQLDVADYLIVLDGKLAAVIERKTLKDYSASFKDGRSANKAKLINARNTSGCQIYYVVEGAINPDFHTEYAGIKYQNILASTNDLMIRDNIFVLRTIDATHTCKTLKMLCESYLRLQQKEAKKVSAEFAAETTTISDINDETINTNSVNDNIVASRSEISFEEVLSNATFTPEEKLKKSRVEAWATIKGVGPPTAAIIATQFKLSDWILGKIDINTLGNFTFNGRKNNKLVAALSLKPNLEMQIKILAEMMGFSPKSARELLTQYSLEDLLLDRDFSHVRCGTRNTKLTREKINKIKNYLSELNV